MAAYKIKAMKYLVRAVKYFFYFAILTSLVVLALVYTGMAQGDINTLFVGGYDALWKMAGFFAVVAAFYPKLGFINRRLYINPSTDIMPQMELFMRERRYEVESKTADCITFRVKGMGNRLVKMYEDRITLTRTSEGYHMEGLRKDVLRIASALEYKFSEEQES